MGAKSRRKGAVGEREAVVLAIECGHTKAYRSAPLQAAIGGADEHGDIGGINGLYVEVKRHERVPVSRLAAELLETDRPGLTSVLLSRDNGSRWLATLDAREYLHRHDELLRLRSEVLFLRAALRQVPSNTDSEDWPERQVVAGQDPEAAGLSSAGTWKVPA